ncbi:pif-1 [Artaxa digramma nucleopolyhedrovirus]|uniref:Pif-1 n=1 Tax=Artaxa digramma nucleopolyhedrovirus TaxID=3070910 RepID=A0AAE6R7Z8_9ABAC|nr:pif-1 [Euproctis digramma nucleopolyhedrovirus]QHB21782.1 pif-1 [Artaxa digramma nucleopolyhedrovirus]
MFIIVLLIFLIVIIVAIYSLYVTLQITDEPQIVTLRRFDNDDVAYIEPPSEIVIEGNAHECHKSLTPCTTHVNCDVCREGLANCQYFDEKTVIEMSDANGNVVQHTILPGESYCMALDRERARSCNPHTGLWLLAETRTGFSLLCHCLTPGLVTQLSMYEDCAVAVGCQPHGHIADLNESPLRCVCDDGYVAEFDNVTQTPHCRPRKVRDIVYDEAFFHRAPCQDGFVRIDHPALNDVYRQELRLPDICVVDPCSVDPISGQRTLGRLQYYSDGTLEYKYCQCSLYGQLFAVHSASPSMIGDSSEPVVNACIRPFNVHFRNVHRIEYKFFWGHLNNNRSDDDVVAAVAPSQLSHDRYRRLTYAFLTNHPELSDTNGLVLFKFSTANDTIFRETQISDMSIGEFSLFQWFVAVSRRTSAMPCMIPGQGRCITVNSNHCIRRHTSAQVWTAETFTNSWCVLSREGRHLRIWSPAARYPRGQAPAALRVNILFSLLTLETRTYIVKMIRTGRTSTEQLDNLTALLDTYANYSIN